MLETKEPPPIVPAEVVPVTVPTDAQTAEYELKATKLRRAATALLFMSVVCSRPWPSVGWAGLVSAVAILCASPNTILCRARVGRFFSAITMILAGVAFVTTVISIRSGAPQHMSDQVHNACNDMPADTFSWGQKIVNEHPCLHKAVAMISRHVSNDTAVALVTPATASWRDANSSFLVAPEVVAAGCVRQDCEGRHVRFQDDDDRLGRCAPHPLPGGHVRRQARVLPALRRLPMRHAQVRRPPLQVRRQTADDCDARRADGARVRRKAED